jgi:chaperonin cofactor prefoldin
MGLDPNIPLMAGRPFKTSQQSRAEEIAQKQQEQALKNQQRDQQLQEQHAQLLQQQQELQMNAAKAQAIGNTAYSAAKLFSQMPIEAKIAEYPKIRAQLIQDGLHEDDLPEMYDTSVEKNFLFHAGKAGKFMEESKKNLQFIDQEINGKKFKTLVDVNALPVGTQFEQPPKEESSFNLGPGQKRYNAKGEVIAEGPPVAPPQAGFSLSPGQRRYDANGKLVAEAPQEKPAQPAIPVLPPNMAGASRDEILKTIPPNVSEKVRQLLDYKQQVSPYMLSRSPEWSQASELASQIDPTWSAAEFPARIKLLNDFKSGKAAGNVRSLNTLISHIDKLDTSIDQLDNSRFQIVNKIGNAASEQYGNSAVTNFDKAAEAVASEAATLFKGTAGTDQEIKAWRSTINHNQSPEQLKQGVAVMLDLMRGRMESLVDQYQRGMGKVQDFGLLNNGSKKILKKLNIPYEDLVPAGVESTQADGAIKRFRSIPSQDSLPAGKSGGDGGQAPEGTIVEMQDGSRQIKRGGRWEAYK